MITRPKKPSSIPLVLLLVFLPAVSANLPAQSLNRDEPGSIVRTAEARNSLVYSRPVVSQRSAIATSTLLDQDPVPAVDANWAILMRTRRERPYPRFDKLLRTTVVHQFGNHMVPMTLFPVFGFTSAMMHPHMSDAVIELHRKQKAFFAKGFGAL